ncbi:hypothetical protein KY092_08055 [Natronomonas gomsonensis]|uniref:helicase HerA domain-containing protein n=1 Tax=Natronomonas gomsonensis TaxID=1046043 RepID=UPI0020CA2C6C|nr:DUF87 domain-containing protein [Natronomonas gomsonensis]MCY4730510.1 hypothetical protein [Natronomonas gomsonensis]
MELERIGKTEISPPTVFLWDTDSSSLVEATVLGEDTYLVRATKAYRLLKQDPEGRESWSRNINKLNEYLESTFSNFRLSVDYVDRVSGETLRVKDEAREVAGQAKELLTKVERLNKEIDDLQESLEISLESMETQVKRKLEGKKQERQRVLDELDHVTQDLERRKDILQEWEENGVLSAILFQFSTEAEVASGDAVNSVIEDHLEQAFNYHRRKVLQTLRGENFRFVVEELEEPSVLMRGEYGMLLNPAVIEDLEKRYENTGVDDDLVEARQQAVKQFEEYAVEDLELEESVVERSNATPAKAVDSILKRLETERVGEVQDVPQDGPMIGTVTGTDVVVGLDPGEYEHFYIVGETGSGKSHLKRTFIENTASLDYHVLSINPSDLQNVGLNLSNEENGNGRSIGFDQYWKSSDQLLDVPDDLTKLFTGRNAVSLRGLTDSEKQDFINDLFGKLADVDSTNKPLFVFLDEAHNFNSGKAANAIQDIVRESRKFGVHLVLISQSPKDYAYNQKHVRENTYNVFMAGEYFEYASRFLDDEEVIRSLDTGEAVFPESRELPRMDVEIRDVLTRFWEGTPSDEEIQEVDDMYSGQLPGFGSDVVGADRGTGEQDPSVSSATNDNTSHNLSEEEEQLAQHIRSYTEREDKRPSTSKCWREGPFGSSKTNDLLDQLEEKGVVESDTEERYGNEATVYSLIL